MIESLITSWRGNRSSMRTSKRYFLKGQAERAGFDQSQRHKFMSNVVMRQKCPQDMEFCTS